MDKKMEKIVENVILPQLIKKLLEYGLIKEEDLADTKLVMDKAIAFLSDENVSVTGSIDHRISILKKAEEYIESNDFELWMTLYAIYIEHSLNRIINLGCEYKKLQQSVTMEIIRNANIKSKCTWIWNLIWLPPISEKYIKIILSNAETRNAFVHYKWQYAELDKINNSRGSQEDINKIKDTKKLITYIKKYEIALEFKWNKNKIKQTIKRRKK